jgi:hypothetical protein
MLKQRTQTTKPKLENHKELPLHTWKLPLNQCHSPWTNAWKPLDENRAAAIGPTLLPVRPVTTTRQTDDTQSPEMARNHLKTFQMHSVAENKLYPPPLLTTHESSPKCKKCNLKLLK